MTCRASRCRAAPSPRPAVLVLRVQSGQRLPGRPTPVGEVVALAAIFDVEPRELFRPPTNYANAAAAERALLALQAKKAELKAVNERIEVLVHERGRLKRERGQLHQQFIAARKAANGVDQ
jgi:hypothetical protein